MKKIRFFLIAALIVVAIATNPSVEAHRIQVKKNFENTLDNKFDDQGLSSLKRFAKAAGELIAPEILELSVKRTNLGLLSITQIKQDGEFKASGIGAFGMVYLFEKPKLLLKD